MNSFVFISSTPRSKNGTVYLRQPVWIWSIGVLMDWEVWRTGALDICIDRDKGPVVTYNSQFSLFLERKSVLVTDPLTIPFRSLRRSRVVPSITNSSDSWFRGRQELECETRSMTLTDLEVNFLFRISILIGPKVMFQEPCMRSWFNIYHHHV